MVKVNKSNIQSKLETRKAVKARKPTYKRVQSNQFAKLSDEKWRRPKGMGNKSRRNRKGHIGMLKIGYGSPKEIRGTNRDGMFEVVIRNVNDLQSIDINTQVGILSQTLGTRKKIEVLQVAKEKKITLSNVKNIDLKIKELTKTPTSTDTKKSKTSSTSNSDSKEKVEVKAEKTNNKSEEAKK